MKITNFLRFTETMKVKQEKRVVSKLNGFINLDMMYASAT